jgi:hypothetical protein
LSAGAGLQAQFVRGDSLTIEADALAVGFCEDARPLAGAAGRLDWIMCGALSRLILANRLRGAAGDAALLTSACKTPAAKIFLIGAGSRSGLTPQALRSAAAALSAAAVSSGVRRLVLDSPFVTGADTEEHASAFQAGLADGCGSGALSVLIVRN